MFMRIHCHAFDGNFDPKNIKAVGVNRTKLIDDFLTKN